MIRPRQWIRITAVLWIVTGPLIGTAWADDVQVNTYTSGSQRSPAVAMDTDGDFVVVWMSDRGGTDPDDTIQGQRFASSGVPTGGQFQVNTYTTGGQYRPAVASEADGDFVVVWESYRSGGPDTRDSIQGQRFASDGSPAGVQFQINTYSTGEQYDAAVAMDADGDFVVVWGAYLYDYYSPVDRIQGQRYASDGTRMGGEFLFNTYTSDDQRIPAVASDVDGDFIVVWRSQSSAGTDTSGSSVQGQRYASDGSPMADDFQVNTTTTNSQTYPAVAMDPEGNFIVVWQSAVSAGTDASGTSIQGQRYAADGTSLGDEFQVNTRRPNDQSRPSVAMNTDGDFVVIWESETSGGTDSSGRSIQGQRYAADGSPVGSQFQVNTYTTDEQRFPSVGQEVDGSFVIVWQSYGSSGTDTDGPSIQAGRVGLIFADGFESGDTSSWSLTTTP